MAASPASASEVRPSPKARVSSAALAERLAARPKFAPLTTLPPAEVGRPYFAAVPALGARAAGWRISAGSLPAGLSFDARTGWITGLPARAADVRLTLMSPRRAHQRSEIRILQLAVTANATSRFGSARPRASTTGTIEGTVTSGGHPLEHACAVAQSASGAVKSVLTSATGVYSLSGLAPGRWEVLFEGCANNVIGQWWPDQNRQTTARAITVRPGVITLLLPVALLPGGAITGTVTVAGSGRRASSVCVYAESAASFSGLATVAQGAAETGAVGTYAITGLPTGTYDVAFVPCTPAVNLQETWWNAQTDVTLAKAASVTAPHTTSAISAALQPGGEISGTVTSTSHVPLADVCAEAISAESFLGGDIGAFGYANGLPSATAVTNPSGDYVITGLATGDYLVEFLPCAAGQAGNYLAALWHQATALAATPAVSVTAGETVPDISASLGAGGSVSGVVTSASTHQPLSDICVEVFSESGAGGLGITGAKGTYLVTGLPGGTYIALFAPCDGQNYLAAVWHGGATFAVKTGAVKTGISAALSAGGQISGTIESAGGLPLTGVCVILNQFFSGGSSGEEGGPVGFGGSFDFAGLATGTYTIGFTGSCLGDNYATEMWNHGAKLHVKAGSVVSGLAFKLPTGGEITGVVSSSTGTALSAMCVSVFAESSGFPVFAGGVTFHGRYYVVGLSTGKDYQVSFAPCSGTENYIPAKWSGAVSVQAGKQTVGISAVLQVGGEITGTVDAAGKVPLSFICVTAVPAFTQRLVQFSAFAGVYAIVGLPAGEYEVEFTACGSGPYATQWWKNVGRQSNATPVQVTLGDVTSGISAVMQRAT